MHAENQTANVPPSPASAVQCVPRGVGADGLDSEWQPFAAHIQACLVVDPDGTPALEIIAVSANNYYERLPEGTDLVPMPRPLILLPGGRVVGRLPHNYPDDPPLATTLQFSGWHDEIPQRIEVHVQSAAGSGTREMTPLVWNSENGKYAAGGYVRGR